eukprot:2114791-Prymnesium_polylepis.1
MEHAEAVRSATETRRVVSRRWKNGGRAAALRTWVGRLAERENARNDMRYARSRLINARLGAAMHSWLLFADSRSSRIQLLRGALVRLLLPKVGRGFTSWKERAIDARRIERQLRCGACRILQPTRPLHTTPQSPPRTTAWRACPSAVRWMPPTATRLPRPQAVHRSAAAWTNVPKARGLRQWKARLAASSIATAAVGRSVERWRSAARTFALSQWRAQLQAHRKAQRALAGWRDAARVAALVHWRQLLGERSVVRAAARALFYRQGGAALRQWVDWSTARHASEQLLRRGVSRMLTAQIGRAFGSWSAWVRMPERGAMRRAMWQWSARELSRSLAQWRAVTEAALEAHRQLRRGVSTWSRGGFARAFNAWRESHGAYMKGLSAAVARWKQRRLSAAMQ